MCDSFSSKKCILKPNPLLLATVIQWSARRRYLKTKKKVSQPSAKTNRRYFLCRHDPSIRNTQHTTQNPHPPPPPPPPPFVVRPNRYNLKDHPVMASSTSNGNGNGNGHRQSHPDNVTTTTTTSSLCFGGSIHPADQVHRNFALLLVASIAFAASFVLVVPTSNDNHLGFLGGTPLCTVTALLIGGLAWAGKPFCSAYT